MVKKRIIKKFEQLPSEIIEEVKKEYPDGFEDNLITFANPKGEIEVALPFETEDTYYLIKMPKNTSAKEEDDIIDNSMFQSFDNFENLEIADDSDSDDDDNDDSDDLDDE